MLRRSLSAFNNMQPNILEQFIDIRILIGFLGERSQCNWWDTNFLSPTGLQFLAINFPRSTLAAGCNSVSEAARRLHDERIGKGGVYHLFRMPATIEETLHKTLIAMDAGNLKAALKDKAAAMLQLKAYIKNTVDAPEGPVQVGTNRHLDTEFAVSELAMHYLNAFEQGKKCFPYFVANPK